MNRVRRRYPFSVAVRMFALLLCLAGTGTAQAVDKLYSPGDTEVDDLARLYRVVGVPFPTASFPVSAVWLSDHAAELEGRLPRRVEEYRRGLAISTREVRTAVSVSFAPQTYLETSYLRGEVTEKLRREAPPLSVAVSGSIDEGPLLFTEVHAIREYGVEYPSNLTPPLSGNPIPYEFNNVYQGYLHWPFEFFTVTFGRQKLDLGPSPPSSIVLAPQVPYLDALRITMRLGPIRMHHSIASIDSTEATEDVDLPAPGNHLYTFDRNQIFFNTHYFEYLFPSWRLGVGANMVVAREMNNFNLSDFFPVFSWHNANIRPRNMSAFLDATVPLAPGFEVYGQASFDDIRTTGVGIGDEPIPTIPAFTLGGRYSRFAGTRTIDAAVDLGYTHYLWGNFPREEGLSRALFRLRAEDESLAFPLTSPYGPGTLFALLTLNLESDRTDVRVLYELVGRKDGANLFTTEHAESEELASRRYTPTHRLEIEAHYAVTSWLSFMLRPGFVAGEGDAAFYLDIGGRATNSSLRTVAEIDRR